MHILVDISLPQDLRRSALEALPRDARVEFRDDLTESGRAEALAVVDVLVGHAGLMTRETLNAATQVRLVHTLGHGVDALETAPLAAILQRKAVRLATSGAAGPAIAEHAVMCMIALGRQLIPVHNALANEGRWRGGKWSPELPGSTLCVIGIGPIGREIARLGIAHGMSVLGVTQNPARHEANGSLFQQVFGYSDVASALAVSDYIVVSAPLTPVTAGLIGSEEFAATKRGAYLVNVARGELVDQDAVYAALQSGQLAGAAFDAWWDDREHLIETMGYPSRNPLHQFNVIMTPHYSGATAGKMRRALAIVGANLARYEAGETLVNEIDVSGLGG